MSSHIEFRKLAAELDGPAFLPGEPGYDAECATYNLLTPLRPAIAVGAATVGDVRAAVRFAGDHKLAVAVRGGGHMQPYTAEGAVLITLDRLADVTVDGGRRTARVTGGARWEEVIDAASKEGLAPMSGSSTTVGAIGYVLGGGQSPIFGRPYGYASDHVTSFDIVTADGVLRTVSAGAEPELFAALRGGKGNFGVVTAMEIELFPVTSVLAGGIYFPGSATGEVLRAWRDWAATLPEQATTSVAVQRLPPVEELPEPLRGAHVVHLRYAYLGPAETGLELLAPMRAAAPALIDTIAEAPYKTAAVLHNDPVGAMPYQDRSLGLAGLPDKALDKLAELLGPGTPIPLTSVELRALGGALDRPPATPDSVPSRGLPFQFFGFAVGGDDLDELGRRLDRLFTAMRPWADPKHRRMLNFLSPEEALDPQSLREVYGAENYDRLLAVKRRFDPNTMFRMNHTLR
ncbi:FAD-binding oxidoreductase [Paractinoplanes deccanensis]|nr:FAD-binding oxidoreductase [Actinoplanes deccanensis]